AVGRFASGRCSHSSSLTRNQLQLFVAGSEHQPSSIYPRKATMAVVGIDLGTTCSAIATLDDRGRPYTLTNRDGEMLTPSAVLFQDESVVVGQPALDMALENPGSVAM